jgi:cell surface protein SprA
MLKQKFIYISLFILGTLTLGFHAAFAQQQPVKADTIGVLKYPFKDEGLFQYPDEVDAEPMYMSRPSNIERDIQYDPATKQYIITEKVGNVNYRLPKAMSMQEYVKYDFDRSVKEYWRTRKEVDNLETQDRGLIPQLKIESEVFDNIFGGNTIDIRPQGYVEVSFGYESNYINDPNRPERLRRVPSFDFDQQINLSVTGKIGDKVDMKVNFNSEATFDYENKMNINYAGKEDEIIRKIEAGNVSLPLNGSLIQGGTNLFGLKTEMQFGKLNVTTVISQHKGEAQTIETEGGSQRTKFSIRASEYDENRHFFLSKYFRDNYDRAMATSPVVLSKVTVNKIEVWITNKSQDFTSSRDIVAFVDLGEQQEHISNKVPDFQGIGGQDITVSSYPHNYANGLYQQLKSVYQGIRSSSTVNRTLLPLRGQFDNGQDWERIDQARKLTPNDFTFNNKLGYISLKTALNTDEILAVAYSITVGDTILQVGEFSTDGINSPQTLVLKLLKGTNLSPGLPTWDLMMKNIYSLGAYELSADQFDFNVVYRNDSTNSYINYIPEGQLNSIPLLRVMNLDNANSQNDYVENGDGMFDFIPGFTVKPDNGRIIFPVLEPFGKHLAAKLENDALRKKYVFNAIYDSTKTQAVQDSEHDKFYFVGSYKGSSGTDIMLNSFNLSPGSVKVTAGGRSLVENIDYTVDYALGKVKIINQGLLESGTPIQVSTESQDVFSMQRKSLLGSYANYQFSENFNLGGTMLFLNERPITNKVDMGEEPISNLMLGFDFQYRTRSKFLTNMLNWLPFYDSDVESSISLEGEVAKLIPGRSKTTGNTVYIDDFEGAETPISFTNARGWYLASTPQGQDKLFPEANTVGALNYGFNRARLSWYYIDQLFNNLNDTPTHLKANLDNLANHYTRDVYLSEIYPGKEIPAGTPSIMTVLNLSYYPTERGPYNYDTENIEFNGRLKNPQKRWGGVMRDITTPNFEASNVEYIEFWMLDPFIYDKGTHDGGDLYFNLGNVSEDILKDSRKAFENGLPTTEVLENVDTTIWGLVSTRQLLNHSFSTDATSRQFQDVGLDGLSDTHERLFFQEYLDKLRNILSPEAFNEIEADPSSDNFHYYRGADYDEQGKSILERYKKYNNMEGNSPTTQQSVESYSTTGTDRPDIEDINNDNTLSELEAYYQYKVSVRKEDLVVGRNYVVDKARRRVKLINGEYEEVDWYQFKIPIRKYDEKVGNISDFKSIRFMRMFMTDFSDSTILRMATLNLIRSDWRKVTNSIAEPNAMISSATQFDVSSINIEENGNRSPINYVLPPDIEREDDISSPQLIKQNEQSMLLSVKDLESGDARAVYKEAGIDIRQFKRLKMDVHAEAIQGYPLKDYEVSIFVRLGSDDRNYYEYEIPLKLTPVSDTKYKNDVRSDQLIVWPDENRLDVKLEIFPQLKVNRDAAIRKAGSKLTTSDIYSEPDEDSEDGKNLIKITGNPTLAELDKISVGIRNPLRNGVGARSVEVWVNELRLVDITQGGGWASNGRMSIRLADLGNITVAGSTQSVGWGSINQSVTERSLDDRYQFDVAASVDAGKLAPEKLGLRMPVYYGYSQSVASPEYDPLNSDIRMKDALSLIESPEERDSIRNNAQDVTIRKSFNVTNVTIEPQWKKKERKPMPYNIENFSVSYSQNEQLSHNIDIEKYLIMNKKGTFNYNYSANPIHIEPFKKVKFLDNKVFRIIKDANFSPIPTMISFRTDLNRNYSERQARNNTSTGIDMPLTVQKDFLWNRSFDLRYNLTRNLNIDFSNQNVARIDELDGPMNPDSSSYQMMQQEIMRNLRNLGRPVDYQHTLNVRYNMPINKLPLLEWVATDVTYQGRYNWKAGPKLSGALAETMDLGNVATNGMTLSLNGRMQFTSLYDKVPYFKKVNAKYQSTYRGYGSRNRMQQQENQRPRGEEPGKQPRTKEVKYNEKKVAFKAEIPKSIFHKLGTEKVDVIVIGPKGDTIKGEVTIVNENRVNFMTEKSINDAKVMVVGTREVGESFAKKSLDITTRMLLGVRSATISYNNTGATTLPGFLPTPYIFGGSEYQPAGTFAQIQNSIAPTLPFLMGWQDRSFGLRAANRGWVTTDASLNEQYLSRSKETYSINVQVEPIPNVRIDLTGSHSRAQNISSYLVYKEDQTFTENSRKDMGTFDMSIYTLKTAFLRSERIREGESQPSALYDNFLKYRETIMARLNEQRGYVEGRGYLPYQSYDKNYESNGYSNTAIDVLIPSFLAAYTGSDPTNVSLNPFPGLSAIRPNWRINYNGDPSGISWLKDYVQSLNFSHSYRAVYSVGQFETNLNYNDRNASGFSWVRNQIEENTSYFVPQYDINSVNIQEMFSPLFNIDIGWMNDLSTSMEIRKQRNLSLSFTNNQITEMMKNEFSMGIGYRFTGMDKILKTKKKTESVSNDVNLRLDVSSSNYKTIYRKIVEADTQPASGMKNIDFDFSADYMLSDKFTMRLFYKYTFNKPYTSETYENSHTNFGLSFNFTIM